MEDEQIMKAITPRVRQLMAMAAKAAEATGDNYIGLEHIEIAISQLVKDTSSDWALPHAKKAEKPNILADGWRQGTTYTKEWVDANVWDGEDRSGSKNDWAKFTPNELQKLFDDYHADLMQAVGIEFDAESAMWDRTAEKNEEDGDFEAAQIAEETAHRIRNFRQRLLGIFICANAKS